MSSSTIDTTTTTMTTTKMILGDLGISALLHSIPRRPGRQECRPDELRSWRRQGPERLGREVQRRRHDEVSTAEILDPVVDAITS